MTGEENLAEQPLRTGTEIRTDMVVRGSRFFPYHSAFDRCFHPYLYILTLYPSPSYSTDMMLRMPR